MAPVHPRRSRGLRIPSGARRRSGGLLPPTLQSSIEPSNMASDLVIVRNVSPAASDEDTHRLYRRYLSPVPETPGASARKVPTLVAGSTEEPGRTCKLTRSSLERGLPRHKGRESDPEALHSSPEHREAGGAAGVRPERPYPRVVHSAFALGR
jgi:hypothetical protein